MSAQEDDELIARLLRIESASGPDDNLAMMAATGSSSWLVNPDGPDAAARLTAMREEIERKDELLQFAHDTLVKHRVAHHFRTLARAGGLADLISAIVNKTRAALDHKGTAP